MMRHERREHRSDTAMSSPRLTTASVEEEAIDTSACSTGGELTDLEAADRIRCPKLFRASNVDGFSTRDDLRWPQTRKIPREPA
jgi:hypothetical protein